MQRQRFGLWVLWVLVSGVSLWGLMQVLVSGPTAQEEPLKLPESIRVFGPGGRTLGGPGEFTGTGNGLTRTIFIINPVRLVCATVENTGECRVFLRLEGGTDGKREIDPGETETLCSFTEEAKVECCGGEESKACKYRWRVDDGNPSVSP
jgi:hypothetical protein